MERGRTRLREHLGELRLARGDGRLGRDDARAVLLDRAALHRRRRRRHHDVSGDAAHACRDRDRLREVARAVCRDAARGVRVVEARDRIPGAAELEGAALLQVVALEEEAAAGARVERAAGRDRRAMGAARETRGRGADVGEVRSVGGHDGQP
jgi:hypothetical protein